MFEKINYMERFVKIVSEQERSFVAQNPRTGQSEQVKCIGFVLSDNISSFYGEMFGNAAEKWEGGQTGTYLCDYRMAVRQWTDKDGVIRYQNDVRIMELKKM